MEMLEPALDDMLPKLCWVSISHIADRDRLIGELSVLADLGQQRGIRIICGGQAMDDVRGEVDGIEFLDALVDLLLFGGARTGRHA